MKFVSERYRIDIDSTAHFPLRRCFCSTFEVMRASFGITIVCTRLPLITSRISMESWVKAMMYGKAHTATDEFHETWPVPIRTQRTPKLQRGQARTDCARHRVPVEVELRRGPGLGQLLEVAGVCKPKHTLSAFAAPPRETEIDRAKDEV